MPIRQRKMHLALLTSSALALVLAASGCSDKKSTETHSTASQATKPAMEVKFNTPPVANAGTDLIVRVGEIVTLNGTQSSDPDHDLMTFNWEQTAGPAVEIINADSLSPSFVAPASKQPLKFALTVNDGQIDSEAATVAITVSNRVPTANAGKTIIAKRGSTVSLDGGASVDPDNDKITYKWEQVYGPVVSVTGANTANPVFTMPNASGYIIFALTVNDGSDESIADTVAIKITNTAPIAKVSDLADNVTAGSNITLDGTQSSDAEGDKLAYDWKQVLGTPVLLHNSDSATPSFKAPERPDHLVFELSVNDGEFKSHADSTIVSIKSEPKETEVVPDITKIAQAKEEQTGLKSKEKSLPVLAIADAPKPVDNFLADMAKDFAPKDTGGHGSSHGEKKPSGAHKSHWSYEGDTGPAHWGSLEDKFAVCDSGKSQSPIDIQTTGLTQSAQPIEFNYSTSALNVVNNGHTIQVNYDKGSHAVIGGKRFDLLQFHFHSPSENTIDGKAADLVAHMVHKAEDGQLAVVGVLFNKGADSEFLKPIWANLPSDAGMTTSSTQTIFASNMLPEDKAYYHFSGSLTTPPCSENVNWNVMATSMEASSAQIEAFTTLFPKSVRPVQPLHGRSISLQ